MNTESMVASRFSGKPAVGTDTQYSNSPSSKLRCHAPSQALADSGKIAIAKVVIKTRQHLAAIKPQERGLMLELMHFPDELLDASDFKSPAAMTPGKPEMAMAEKLIDSMSGDWHPDLFKDDYREKLEKVVEEKIRKGGKAAPAAKLRQKPANVIDLVSVLQQSIEEAQRKSKPRKKTA